MSYTPTVWVEKVTKVGPTNLNKLENGLQSAAAVADAALPTPVYAAFTPTLTAATVNPNLGASGTAVGRYVQIGKLVHATGTITFAGAGVAAGTGLYSIALPVTAPASGAICGEVYGLHGSAFQTAVARLRTTAAFDTLYPGTWPAGNFSQFTDTNPWTWAAGDSIQFSIVYEAA